MAEGKMKERIALITGAARGIGFATSRRPRRRRRDSRPSATFWMMSAKAPPKNQERHGESKARFIHHDGHERRAMDRPSAPTLTKRRAGLTFSSTTPESISPAPIETMTIGDFSKNHGR